MTTEEKIKVLQEVKSSLREFTEASVDLIEEFRRTTTVCDDMLKENLIDEATHKDMKEAFHFKSSKNDFKTEFIIEHDFWIRMDERGYDQRRKYLNFLIEKLKTK